MARDTRRSATLPRASRSDLTTFATMISRRSPAIIPLCTLLLAGCSEKQQPDLPNGPWRATLQTPGGELPFGMEIFRFTQDDRNGDSIVAQIINAEERILITDIKQDGDTVFMRLPVFDSEIRAKVIDSTLNGYWIDHNRRTDSSTYRIPFHAQYGLDYRFAPTTGGEAIEERWEVTFSPNAPAESKAVGVFKYGADYVEGTFLTETGDYRYLEGMTRADSIFLSCFDGAHAFLFKAKITGDSMSGMFWSGKHYSEPWIAVLNPDFELRDPDSLTFLTPGYERFEFSFPDTDSNLVSLDDFWGKVVIVQIMGSWCPNCMDESRFFADAWRRYHDDGLEIVALAFEKTRDFNTARERVLRMKQNLEIPYTVLIAGYRDPQEVAQKLPALNHVMSYPTSIFIDRAGKVRRIHTGYSGPATGGAFVEFAAEFDEFVQSLLSADEP